MVPAERPSLNDSAKAISALLCLQRAFSMQNLVAPPMPTHQADTMDDAVYRNGKIERGKAFCAHSPCYEESVREDVAGKPCHSQNIQSYIFYESSLNILCPFDYLRSKKAPEEHSFKDLTECFRTPLYPYPVAKIRFILFLARVQFSVNGR